MQSKVVVFSFVFASVLGGLIWGASAQGERSDDSIKPSPTLRNQDPPQAQAVATAKNLAEWFTPEASFTECIESSGPSGRIDRFGADQKTEVTEAKDKFGRLYRVEVSVRYGENITTWTYYRSKSDCEREQINANKQLSDKYRN